MSFPLRINLVATDFRRPAGKTIKVYNERGHVESTIKGGTAVLRLERRR